MQPAKWRPAIQPKCQQQLIPCPTPSISHPPRLPGRDPSNNYLIIDDNADPGGRYTVESEYSGPDTLLTTDDPDEVEAQALSENPMASRWV